MIPCEVLKSDAAADLDHSTFRLLVLLAGEYRGSNNGALGVTRADAKQAGIRSPESHWKGLRSLEEHGFILPTAPASRTPPRPAMYALTWASIDATEHSSETRTPSFDYRSWSA